MNKSFLLVLVALVLLTAPSIASAQYQTDQQGSPDQKYRTRPQLQIVEAARIKDELAPAGDQFVIYRSGENIPMALTPGAVLRLGLDSGLNTGKLKEGVTLTRLLEIRAPLQSPFNATYADKGAPVETEFSGRSSGFKDRAILVINPRQFQIEVGPTEYKVIGTLAGHYIVLKPGKWRFDLQCSLTQVVSPDGTMWTASTQSETGGIVGKRFGREGSEQFYSDPLTPLASIPQAAIIYPYLELKSLFKFLIHRPNIILPGESDIYLHVDRMTGTYLGPPLPTQPTTVVR